VGTRLLGPWRRHWFTPAPLTDLGVGRVVLAAILLWLGPTTRYLRVALIAPSLWVPVPLISALGIGQPGLATLRWMGTVTALLLVFAAAGVGTRVALVLLVPLVLVQEAWLNCMGKVTHGTIPLLWALLFFALAPCDRSVTLASALRRVRRPSEGTTPAPESRDSPYARWPLELLFVELAGFYFLAGLAKLRAGGLAWADGYTLQYHLLANLQHSGPGAYWLAEHLGLCRLASILVLVFELGMPLGLVRRLRPLALAGGALFHGATTWFLGITFWPVVALYALFVPWTRIGHALGRRTARARAGGTVGGGPDVTARTSA